MSLSKPLAYLVTFTASFLIMVIELVAGRILAPYIGQHLYSWTSIIGVCLAGISLGAWLGGWLADRFPRRSLLGWVLFLAGLLSLAIPILADTIGYNRWFEYSVSLLMRIVLYTGLIFLWASLALGMVSPIVIRLVMTDLKRTGSTVGRIYAFSTVGSIAGTFATGFFLIEEFGTRPLLYAVGAILIVIAPLVGGVFGRGGKALAGILLILAAGGIATYCIRPDWYVQHLTWLKKNVARPLAITREKVPDLGLTTKESSDGAEVTQLVSSGVAASAEVAVGDVIIGFDGSTVTKPADLEHSLGDGEVGREVSLKYLRAGKLHEAHVKLIPRWKYKFEWPTEGYIYYNETSYYTLNVRERIHHDRDTGERRALNDLILDNLVHSHSDPDDPRYLAYDYLRIYEELVDWKLKGKPTTKHKQFFIGGGGYTLQRLFNDKYKDSHIDVAEIDPGVTLVAEEFMYSPKNSSRLVTINQDARLVVLDKYRKGEKYEFVFGDAFNDLSIPFHLTTAEFDAQVKGLLTPDGLLMSLVIDHVGRGQFLPSFLATMRQVFGDDNVALILATAPTYRTKLLRYLENKKLGEFIPQLQEKKLSDLLPQIKGKLAKDNDEKQVDEILAELEDRKSNDLAPYIKPYELDHVDHSTVIVVASPMPQDWEAYDKYLKELNTAYGVEGTTRSAVSHVIKPKDVTEYLKTRVRATTWVDRLLGRTNKEEIAWTPVILTDDYAPVDNLTAPMFEKRYGYDKAKVEERRKLEEEQRRWEEQNRK